MLDWTATSASASRPCMVFFDLTSPLMCELTAKIPVVVSFVFDNPDQSSLIFGVAGFQAMAPEDSRAPFLRIPWAASLLNRPNIITRVPGSRKYKASTEDSLFAEILKTPRTIRSCISFYTRPAASQKQVDEVSTLMTLGDGINGHPGTMHGGIVAAILDEAMGILQTVNYERDHIAAVGTGRAEGELPPFGVGSYTRELKVQFLKPVLTPGNLIATARYIKRDGRKEWIYAEIKQRFGADEDYDGDEIICATAEGFFLEVKNKPSKL